MKENRIIGDVKYNNSRIVFSDNSEGNVFYVPEGESVTLKNCVINFCGKNSLVVIRNNSVSVNATIFNESTLYLGKNCYINSCLNVIPSERTSIFIGDDLLCSYGVYIRTADPHLIYDGESHRRINPSKSVFIGDHVWIGQDVGILKNTFVGSGAIIAAKALLSNKVYSSNGCFGGVPAKKVKDNVFWTGACVHAYTQEQTDKSLYNPTDAYLYHSTNSDINPKRVIQYLDEEKDVDKKIEFLNSMGTDKNRFYLG